MILRRQVSKPNVELRVEPPGMAWHGEVAFVVLVAKNEVCLISTTAAQLC